jgi:hypothetical protein
MAKTRKPEEETAPLLFSLAIMRDNGRMALSHTIEDEKDLALCIDAIMTIQRDLNNALVEMRVAAAVNGQKEIAEVVT